MKTEMQFELLTSINGVNGGEWDGYKIVGPMYVDRKSARAAAVAHMEGSGNRTVKVLDHSYEPPFVCFQMAETFAPDSICIDFSD